MSHSSCATPGEIAMFLLRFKFALMDHPKLAPHFRIKIHCEFLQYFKSFSIDDDGYISILELPGTIEELNKLYWEIHNHYSCSFDMAYPGPTVNLLSQLDEILICLSKVTSKQLKYGLFGVEHVYRYLNLIYTLKYGRHAPSMFEYAKNSDYAPVLKMLKNSVSEEEYSKVFKQYWNEFEYDF